MKYIKDLFSKEGKLYYIDDETLSLGKEYGNLHKVRKYAVKVYSLEKIVTKRKASVVDDFGNKYTLFITKETPMRNKEIYYLKLGDKTRITKLCNISTSYMNLAFDNLEDLAYKLKILKGIG